MDYETSPDSPSAREGEAILTEFAFFGELIL